MAVTVRVEDEPLVIVFGFAVMFTVGWVGETVTVAVAEAVPLLFVAIAVYVVVDEGLLNRVKIAALHQAFDGRDGFALGFDSQGGAGIDRLAIDDHRASAASGAVADALGAGHVQVIAQGVEQSDARFQLQVVLLAVDVE